MTKDFDLLMEMRERDRDQDRECGGDSVRDEREPYGNRDRERDRDTITISGIIAG